MDVRRRPCWVAMALAMLMLQVSCATGTPMGRLGGYAYQPFIPRTSTPSPPVRETSAASLNTTTWASKHGVPREDETRERARQVERERVAALVSAAQREGRDEEAAREAEAERALARVVGLCSGVEEVGTVLSFAFWVEGRALTPVSYQEERGGGRVGRPVDTEGLTRVLRRVFTEYLAGC